ncbi:MAG: adenine phosphoribosyltransferase [Bacteroidetes bacterium]|nr:MAG: adenine phosphoribosyltransferase [Bacteroidota bacterium]
MDFSQYIRDVKDFPKQGIVFKDITTLLKDATALRAAGQQLYEFAKDLKINKVVGIESRGFIYGLALADKLGAGFVPVRKPNKLPAETLREEYTLEYGTDALEIHKDAIQKGDRILIHDDLLATGGTAAAACKLVEALGGEVLQLSFLIELGFLQGRKRLEGYDIKALIAYNAE